jgi:triosephosphate isomerase
MRKPFVAGNWKMNTTGAQAEQLAKNLVEQLRGEDRVDVAVFPPFPYLSIVAKVCAGTPIAIGGQNTHPDTKGAFTGEVSPTMLIDCGCRWAIIGHSERRHLLGEDIEFIRRKLVGALAAGLHTMLCVGETLAQRRANQTEIIIETQLSGALEGLPSERMARMVVAYEPVWAIGTGQNATPEQAELVHQFIRRWLSGQFGDAGAQQMRVLYGGSVKPDNAASLMGQPNVDGLLVGGASLDANDFTAIVHAAAPKK